jgi:hypothetical protein
MAEALVFELRRVTRSVEGVGLCEFRAPSISVERPLRVYYRDKDEARSGEFIDLAISEVLVSPRLSPEEVAALPESIRKTLRAGVADASRLPDVPAAALSDEALLLAMRERHARAAEQLRQSMDALRDHYAEGFVRVREAFRPRLKRLNVSSIIERAAQTAVFAQRWREIGAFYRNHPLSFVISQMRSRVAFTLLLDSEQQGDRVLAEALDRALLDDGDFADLVGKAAGQAACLNEPERVELSEGLRGLRDGRPFPAVLGQVLGPLEGMLWRIAKREDVINEKRELLRSADGHPTRPRLRRARNATHLFDEKAGLDLSDHLRLFLEKVFDATGQDLRHRRSDDGHREYTLWALIGIAGLLDRCEGTQLMLAAGERLDGLYEIDADAA